MKKQLSTRIGAILTTAAMLMTSLTMAIPVMAAGETATNYITNGDFSSTETLAADLVFSGSDATNTTTIKKGDAIPAGWEIVDSAPHKNHVLNVARNLSTHEPHQYLGTKNILVIKGNSIGVKQTVTNLTPGQSYNLSLNLYSNIVDNGVTLTVKFGKYTDTYTGFESLADKSGLMVGQLLNISGKTTTTSISRNLLTDNPEAASIHSLNFVMPPEANAAVVQITGVNLGSSEQVTLDDVVLTEGKEVLNNGSFEKCDSAGLLKYDWYNADPKATSETTGNRYLKFSSANTNHRQFIVVKPGKVYKLSFKYAQNGFTDGASPNVILTDYIDIDGNCSVTPSYDKAASSDLDWKTYEAYFTVPTNADYALDMAVVGLVVGTPNVDWPSGATYSYDDISLQEADETVMGFAVAGANGSFVTEAADAKTASCIYMQGATPAVAKFIVAKYNSTTHALENASVVNAGNGIAAGNAVRYNVELDELSGVYYRIFLFDGTTLTPVLDSQRIG